MTIRGKWHRRRPGRPIMLIRGNTPSNLVTRWRVHDPITKEPIPQEVRAGSEAEARRKLSKMEHLLPEGYLLRRIQ